MDQTFISRCANIHGHNKLHTSEEILGMESNLQKYSVYMMSILIHVAMPKSSYNRGNFTCDMLNFIDVMRKFIWDINSVFFP